MKYLPIDRQIYVPITVALSTLINRSHSLLPQFVEDISLLLIIPKQYIQYIR